MLPNVITVAPIWLIMQRPELLRVSQKRRVILERYVCNLLEIPYGKGVIHLATLFNSYGSCNDILTMDLTETRII